MSTIITINESQPTQRDKTQICTQIEKLINK